MDLTHRLHDLVDRLRLLRRNIALLGVDYFSIKARYFRAAGYIRLARLAIAIIAVATLLTILVLKGCASLYTAPWAGFGAYEAENGEIIPAKTLWDWLDLLIVPLAIAIIAFLFRRSEAASSRAHATDRSREEALGGYLDRLQDLLLDTDYGNEEAMQDASRLATARTIALLRQLDVQRKAIVLRFLYEAGLISGNPPFVSLQRADLSRIRFDGSSLTGANLGGALLDDASLEWTWLSKANLSGASMVRATVSSAYLMDANLEYALMDRADFYSANLTGASLIKAKAPGANFARAHLEKAAMRDIDLTGANLRGARLKGACLLGARMSRSNLRNADLREANLAEANLMYADLTGADLTGADITNAIVSRRQLRKAKAASGAKLDGIRDRPGPPHIPSGDQIEPSQPLPFGKQSEDDETAMP